ncbi:lytic murein transglycosylase [Aliiroseovarius sp.]|uniref:lytic murein transglycosylase n=1 Tax=Aliiroseovarius sp. TaxID=1872442 RepID=UPI00262A21B0|nr:lytic murein transglycosylase [Aliiroseovarius sp.]
MSGLAAVGLAGCQAGGTGLAVRPSAAWPRVPDAGWQAWVAGFRRRAAARGIPARTLAAAFRGAGYIPAVIERDRNQFQDRRSLEDYLAIATSDERLSLGRAALARQGRVLARVETQFGVPAEVIAAIWGVESRFGTRRGEVPVISALSTLAYDGRRGRFFENQLMAALKILQQGDVTPARMTGSWAGAMGHTQFIPTTFNAYAVDFDGDGRRDIWANDPGDALASAAAYLRASGWRPGQPWAVEAGVPDGYSGGFGRRATRSLAAWRSAGVQATRGPLPQGGAAGLIQPQGAGTPAFLVFHNFNILLKYNASEKYALSVGHLADRLSGAGALVQGFGPDEHGLTLLQRKELQRQLTARGHDAGAVDGVIGKGTEAAIRSYQRAAGLPADGVPSLAFLQHLRG